MGQNDQLNQIIALHMKMSRSARYPFQGLNANSNVPARGSYLVAQTTAAAVSGKWTTTNIVRWTEELNVSPFLTAHNTDDVGLVNVNQ